MHSIEKRRYKQKKCKTRLNDEKKVRRMQHSKKLILAPICDEKEGTMQNVVWRMTYVWRCIRPCHNTKIIFKGKYYPQIHTSYSTATENIQNHILLRFPCKTFWMNMKPLRVDVICHHFLHNFDEIAVACDDNQLAKAWRFTEVSK